ncbi:Uncharacterised protein (plasmid) [Tsukamurella tyrosinosolvens]|uniref:Uncharacterized protein n=1 Tax=Tsukamurella tyrosinosolvens TaxID=57704 RepID=A0A1H4UYY4_TSUTY|nr:hypothetical protein [Tsukamurella tyrosinosolvens]KXO91096.1 hypothetical protein AXK58_21950 [Tsukamurella tyrosinosolvens]SEC74049.1 hypothetical protein SAMN04489793_3088 [Tsukamurella tyrosinosolvens]VEH90785.1 Uncharacterised protein [Tsukamurella tyrosinosolvens]
MSLYHCTIALDGDNRQVIVHWDDNDANTHIVAPITIAASELDEAKLVHLVASMGFRMVSTGSDNVGRGWAIVARTNSNHPFYDPIAREWRAFLSDDQKAAIRTQYPDATVPGVH